MTATWRHALVLTLALAISACGFALRGATELSFDTLWINVSANSQFGAQLRRELRAAAPTLRIVEDPQAAEVRLEILDVIRERLETALNAQGRVQEYELTLRLRFQVTDPSGEPLIPETTLTTSRLLPWDDNVAQAKETEADTLYRAMQADLAQRVLSRLASPALDQAILENEAAAASRPLAAGL